MSAVFFGGGDLFTLCGGCVCVSHLGKVQWGKIEGKGIYMKKNIEVPYQLLFANPEGSFANRSLIKSLYGKFRKADPEENKSGVFIEHSGWA